MDQTNREITGLEESVVQEILTAITSVIGEQDAALHEPYFDERETVEVMKCLESGFVSSVGPTITQFEDMICDFTNANYAIAVVNGTAALHLMLLATGIRDNDEVLVPAMTFVATGNAILHAKAIPHFVDSSADNLGVDTEALEEYLCEVSEMRDGHCWNKKTNRWVTHLLPVHVFGHIGDMDGLKELAQKFGFKIIEDAAEALGSRRSGCHAGLFGLCGSLSFNGNKIITTGGGGAILTNDEKIADRVRYLATTAKLQHQFEYFHTELAYNYRMPALNAALGVAQLGRLDALLSAKAQLSHAYKRAFDRSNYVKFFDCPTGSISNHWLNAILLNKNLASLKNDILHLLNDVGFGCRPVWNLLSDLPYFRHYPKMPLTQSTSLANRIINIPSSAQLLTGMLRDV